MNQILNKLVRPIGPGTMAMLIGLLGLGIYSFVTRPEPLSSRYYEADSKGQLRETAKPNVGSVHPAGLWKPEPDDLLDQGPALRLGQGQLHAIERTSDEWKLEKGRLEARLAEASTAVIKSIEKGFSVVRRREAIEEYTVLSRRYDQQRQAHWEQAISILDETQRRKLKEVLP